MSMEIKKTISHFAYKIEEKPGGGFIAQPLDPANAPIEGATREEVMQKIQAQSVAELERELPELLNAGGLEGKLANLLASKAGLQGAVKVNITTTTKRLGDTASTTTTGSIADPNLLPSPVANGPIIRSDAGSGSDRTGTALRILAALIALGAIVYFLSHR
jgi:hypothetical protein